MQDAHEYRVIVAGENSCDDPTYLNKMLLSIAASLRSDTRIAVVADPGTEVGREAFAIAQQNGWRHYGFSPEAGRRRSGPLYVRNEKMVSFSQALLLCEAQLSKVTLHLVDAAHFRGLDTRWLYQPRPEQTHKYSGVETGVA